MARFFRALFISAVATGAAAGILALLSSRERPAPPPAPPEPGDVADDLPPEARELLLRELAEQL